jgi:histidinol-phosphate/aromatic aminotransferase/cobyric acid decarboxylase-like protein
MAMAALRVGYLLAAPELAREVSKAVLPYNLNAISEAAAEVAVELYDSDLKPTVDKLISERERVFHAISEIDGLVPVPSSANFMIVKSDIAPRTVFDRLLEHGILVRNVSTYPMLSNYFRISVGKPEENDALLAALKRIFGVKADQSPRGAKEI